LASPGTWPARESTLSTVTDIRSLPQMAKSEPSAQLADAWLRWRGDRTLPRRADVKLSEIARILPVVGLLEVRSADEVHVRVAGTGMRELYGAEITGRNLKDVTAPGDWVQRAARYRALGAQPCGAIFTRRDVLPNGRIVVYEGLALPIDADAFGAKRQVIFTVAPLEKSFAVSLPPTAREIPLAADFQFIDIGASVPTDV
jgi:hypothetical protein